MLFSTRIAKIIFIISALTLLALSTILYIQIKDLDGANKSINRSTEVKLLIEQAISYTKDAETAQRGFLITRDSLFLQPYWGAFEKTDHALSDLKSLVKNDKEQEKNLEKLDSMIHIRISFIDAAIDSIRFQASPLIQRQILLRDKALMDSIRKQTNKMELAQKRDLGTEKLEQIRHSFKAPLLGVLLIFLSLAILSASYYRVTQDLKRSGNYLAETQRLNAELEEKNRQLLISNEELDSFNYISSHDLQEPVRKIRTFINMIEETDYEKLSERNKYNFQRVQSAAIRIQELLHDLLTYSQIGKGEQHFKAVDLNNLLEDTKQNLEHEIELTNATFETDRLPTVYGIPFQMQQLFDNLISNSLKYKQKEVAPHIQVRYKQLAVSDVPHALPATNHTLYHQISVIDNGLGFNEEYADKIFEPFSRLHTNDQFSGTGIGLTICKKIINNHNGMIRVESKVLKGATFHVYLPVLEPSKSQV
ncbi:MAG TPA: ATP-binding protein [Chitinophagaceae bacterium]|nr:ATP-binding protein [Chitinophagaceae bacterium]